ncbi:MAG: HlyD family efflux transporter periplasmic adaptor subunit [Ruminococcaceae bacterium]|jgi:multidrug efflux pump subunit AcrA (membrane-fusion protein)|nr:HlyD family efflux transporter periplasmic adaptor subunit [Oscillospiraceae bacterium]
MAEVIDQEKQSTEAAGAPSGFSDAAPVQKRRRRNRKKIIRRIIALVLVAALAGGGFYAWKRFGGPKETEKEILRDTVSRGSITSMVNGSGAAVAKNSESVTLIAGGKVREVYVTEGDYVTAGTPLFEIDSTEVEEAIATARERVRNAETELADRRNELAEFLKKPTEADAVAEYNGILVEVGLQKMNLGDDVAEKEVLAKLVDNTRMRLTLYFSYAYENDIQIGQPVSVSIPVTMASIPGEVIEIHKVDRVTKEGGRMFEVVVAMDNPGTLTEEMTATATLTTDGETIYPYEPGKLEYYRSTVIRSPMSGSLTSYNARDYQKVQAGQGIAHIQADLKYREEEIKNYNTRIQSAEESVKDANEALEKAMKTTESLSGVATIDGTVLSVGIQQGEEAKAGTVAVSIADTSTMIVNAMLDEMYISYAKVGMMVNIKLWENELYGTIESVSLTANAENGVARFPMVISVDNSEGLLMSGAYVDYSFTASQSEDCLIVSIPCVKSAQTTDGETVKVIFVETDVPPENPVELATDMMQIPEGFWPVVVETGISDSNNIEILSGVEEGMSVYAGVVENNSGMGGMGYYF